MFVGSKNLNVGFFSESLSARSFTFCMMIASIELTVTQLSYQFQ